MAIAIREARADEHSAVGALTVAGYQTFYGAELGEYATTLRDAAARAVGAAILVAVDGDALVGTVTYVWDARSPAAEHQHADEAAIRMLAVAPGHQGRGTGRALTVACIERARAEGRRAIVLHADEVMPISRRLYERLGFVRDPARDFVAPDGTTLLGYALALGSATRR